MNRNRGQLTFVKTSGTVPSQVNEVLGKRLELNDRAKPDVSNWHSKLSNNMAKWAFRHIGRI